MKQMDKLTTKEIETLDGMLLTTKDNPFNPHTDYDKWRTWDEAMGYYTEAYVARVADIPIDMDLDDDVAIDSLMLEAVRSILDNDPEQLYELV